MNLLCLHCGQRFLVNETAVESDGATVMCVHCGEEQPLYVRGQARPESSDHVSSPPDVPPAPSVSDLSSSSAAAAEKESSTVVGGFRKPMSSMWGDRTSDLDIEPETGDQTVKMAPPNIPDTAAPAPQDDGSFVIGGIAENSGEISTNVGGGPFVVHSPSALALEFPDFQVLDDWARIVDKQDKYTVTMPSGDTSNLQAFLKKRKSGGRSGVVRNARISDGTQGNDTIQDMLIGGKHSGVNTGSSVAQFEFKLEEEPESRFNKGILLWVVGVVVVLGVLAASMIFFYN